MIYRDVVANLKYQSDSDSSGIDGNNQHIESDSDCSGATEGPEEVADQSDDSIMDDDSFLTSQQLRKLHNLPKSLHLVVEHTKRKTAKHSNRINFRVELQ